MEKAYKNQKFEKGHLQEGDFIYFREGRDNVTNSGVVGYVDDMFIDINNVNGDGDSITRKLSDITLCYDAACDEEKPGPDKPKVPKKSRSKYQPGAQIISVDELMKQDLVYMHGRIWNMAWLINLQVGWIARQVYHGHVRYAIRKSDLSVAVHNGYDRFL